MSYNFDPEFRDLISLIPAADFSDVEGSRQGIEAMLADINGALDTSGLDIEDRMIPGLNDDPELAVRIYLPKQRSGTTGALLYIHGGGFTVGSLNSEHASVCNFANDLGVPIVSVDYRLAPEATYPEPVDDCYAALLWLHANIAEFDIDPERIAIIGLSAGAGLSASTVLRAKSEGGPAICHQFLGIPELDDRLQTPSMTQFTDTPLWNRPNAIASWNFYLSPRYTPGADDVPVEAAPARATADDVKGLPPTFISAMEFDPLRDEAIYYALTLLEAGIPVELHVYPGTFHGSSLFTEAAVSQRQQNDINGALRRALKIDN
ncbi:MAG: alpha/beta hydrolase [Pseudomonadales bacterium]